MSQKLSQRPRDNSAAAVPAGVEVRLATDAEQRGALVAYARRQVQAGAGHECSEWIRDDGQCLLCDQPVHGLLARPPIASDGSADNLIACQLGAICAEAGLLVTGDAIDRGLRLLRLLSENGFEVYRKPGWIKLR